MPKLQSNEIPEYAGDFAYQYENSRPFTVFGLAAIAAVGALSFVWGAWSVLEQAESAEQIASPPDLKAVMEFIDDGGRSLATSAASVESEASEGESNLADKDADDKQPVDQSI